MEGDEGMMVVDWYEGVVKRGSRERIVFRVPKWARDLWDEHTLKVICWLTLDKPKDLDVDRVEIVDREKVMVVEDW